MSISQGALQSAGCGPRDDRWALDWRTPFGPKRHVMQALVALLRFIQPFMPVLGVLIGAGAAKSGHGGWAASMILVSLSTYFGVVATAMLARNLGAWVARIAAVTERPTLQLRNSAS